MTPIEALLISIELLREAHKRLYAVDEIELAAGITIAILEAGERLTELRKEK